MQELSLGKTRTKISAIGLPSDYKDILKNLKDQIRTAQIKSAFRVNQELVVLYWKIGQTILQRQEYEGWGAKIIDRLSQDLTKSFPDMKGFSPRNLKYMRAFAESYPNLKFVQGVLAQLTWYHNIALLEKVADQKIRLWYAQKAIENGWSRNILAIQIERNLYKRQGKAITNFKIRLPQPQSDLAENVLKDPYVFDFLSVGDKAHEREIERDLVKHITNFLLELGAGFSFVGRQYHLEIDKQDFYIDLLFYHLKLRCYVVVEIKAGKFRPEYAGQINFYLSAVDDLLKHPEDNPSIGLLLCKDRNKIIAEYALKSVSKAIGVSEYKIVESIPQNLKVALPTIEDLERELAIHSGRKK